VELAYAVRDEASSGLLVEPEWITPEQYQDRVSRALVDQPEIRLMLAVMDDAIAVYQRFSDSVDIRDRRLFEEASAWIHSSDTSWPYSFENICTALRFDAASVRSGLERWRIAHRASHQPLARVRVRNVLGRRPAIGSRAPSASFGR
jgi:hypothetical protein